MMPSATREAPEKPAFLAGAEQLWPDRFTAQNENAGTNDLLGHTLDVDDHTPRVQPTHGMGDDMDFCGRSSCENLVDLFSELRGSPLDGAGKIHVSMMYLEAMSFEMTLDAFENSGTRRSPPAR